MFESNLDNEIKMNINFKVAFELCGNIKDMQFHKGSEVQTKIYF